MASKFFKDKAGNPMSKAQVNKSETIKVMDQTGEFKDIPRDLGRGAKLPGKRVSRTGKVYWETRKNRSDKAGKRI